ncbi:MAG: sodium:proton exchanger [Bacteroidetes bacterium SW_4_67_19]|jgi:cation:H+ antiporter|nr:MAG: sodium:proton exchanger [Bacteroidetes bacterium SW_4_67_19]
MVLSTVVFLVGIGVLYVGAEAMVKGAATLALRYGLRPIVVGLTVVALGTSMPEFVINFFSAIAGEDALAIGNIIGSNICNIALILGISAVVLPLSVDRAMLRKEYPMMLGAMLAFYLLALDGRLGTVDGFLLVCGLVGFLVFVVVDAQRHAAQHADSDADDLAEVETEDLAEVETEDLHASPAKQAGYLAAGMVGLTLGARLMVDSAVDIARYMGVGEVTIGLTIVAVGTSLPELAASVVSSSRGEAEMSVGNSMGSNLLNVLFVVGLVSMMRPLNVKPMSLDVHFPVMIGFTLLLFPLAWTGRRITRLEGSFMLVGFLGYMSYLVWSV